MKPSSFALSREDLTLSSRLVAGIRDAILDGRLAPGQHLKERELCEMFQVSRGLVREAVQKLAAEELITAVPHRGLIVTMLDRKSARDLYQVRASLEGLAFAGFAEFADEDARNELFAITAGLSKLSSKDTPQALVSAKNDLYRCVLAGCGNEVVGQMFTQLNNRIVQLRQLSLSQPGRLPQTIVEIEAIVDAIRRRDTVAARALAEQHVLSAAKVADARFEDIERQARKEVMQ